MTKIRVGRVKHFAMGKSDTPGVVYFNMPLYRKIDTENPDVCRIVDFSPKQPVRRKRPGNIINFDRH